jgi:isochorismate hydrolase
MPFSSLRGKGRSSKIRSDERFCVLSLGCLYIISVYPCRATNLRAESYLQWGCSVDRNLDLPVYLTRHLNPPEDAGQMASWWRDLIRADQPLSCIDPCLEMKDGVIIDKTWYDAFLETPLEMTLQERNIHQLVVCGVMTHLCCETTARTAFMRGFEVLFTVDGTATYTEAFHGSSLLNLAHGFAVPVLVQDILSVLEKNESG